MPLLNTVFTAHSIPYLCVKINSLLPALAFFKPMDYNKTTERRTSAIPHKPNLLPIRKGGPALETLIELYDERPLENVLGPEVFRPRRVVYICPDAAYSDKRTRPKLAAFYAHRGFTPELVYVKAKVFDAESTLRTLRQTVEQYPDCAIDITGGTDAVLFAAGLLSAERSIPVFTYSRRRNSFFDIRNARFAEELPCTVVYRVEDCFVMAGGSVRLGRVDNAILPRYFDCMDPFFRVYLAHRKKWDRIITYIQRVSPSPLDQPPRLEVAGDYTVKAERGSRISAPEQALEDLAEIGLLRNLTVDEREGVRFTFADAQIRTWLRDVGSVLELYVYKACVELGLFDDVRLSAIVDWEGETGQNAVTNELDVVCTKGVIPVFISCKTGEVKTEALNELAILRDRFGGKMAKAAIVTATRGSTVMRNRASELSIAVIDLNDLTAGRLPRRLRSLLRPVR